MHREVHQKWAFSEHKAPLRDEGSNIQCFLTSQGLEQESKNPVQHWPSLVFSVWLLIAHVYLPPHYSQSKMELGHTRRRKSWDTLRKKGWAGAVRAFGWSEWSCMWCSHTSACSALRAWHLMDISSNATRQSLYSWNTAQHLTFMLARKHSSDRKVVILMARADID